MKNLLLISNSTLYGSGYLDHCEGEIKKFLDRKRYVLFVPYARPSGLTHDDYTEKAKERFARMGYRLSGIHRYPSYKDALTNNEAVFVGGGNTFRLLKALQDTGADMGITECVNEGMLYMGASAGSNVAGRTIGTTNDMPIVQPSSFDALGLVPFNINPHYIDADSTSKHMGETRETRIMEFHDINSQPVVALREGAMLRVYDGRVELKGENGAKIFRRGAKPRDYFSGEFLDFLLE